MIESCCGILCSECKFKVCEGCVNVPNPFWGKCPVKECCETKKHNHCGECEFFPCELLVSYSYDSKEGDDGKRIKQCRKNEEFAYRLRDFNMPCRKEPRML